MTAGLDVRLARLQDELRDHTRIARHLGLDLERPVRALEDGYPENAVTLVGRITERLLKQLWRHHKVPGTPAGKTLKELITGCKPHIRSQRVLDALYDILRLRNRSAHDGYTVADEDGMTAIRRLIDFLSWYASTGSGALGGGAPRLSPAVARKAEFLAGLYVTLDYRPVKRFELSSRTVYQLLVRERGLRSEYVELLLSRDVSELARVLQATSGELLRTSLPKLTRFLILEDHGTAPVPLPEPLREDFRVLSYDRFMDAFVDLDRHITDMTSLYPPLGETGDLVEGDLLAAGDRTGEMILSSAGTARDLLDLVAAEGGNLLIVGRPGTGKTTLLKQLVAAPPGPGSRRYRFFVDLSLRAGGESFADFVTRVLAPCMRVEAAYVFAVFCYFARAGSVLCAIDGFDEAVPELTQTGFLALFAEIADVISAESAVVIASRVSFLEDSPPVRRLLDGTSLISEKLVQQLHAHGVDPLALPRFSVLRLRDDPPGGPPLARHLTARDQAAPQADLAGLLWRDLERVAGAELLPHLVGFFGPAFLRGVTTFTLIALVNEFGPAVFAGGRVDFAGFGLRELFRVTDAGQSAVAFRHIAYQELLAAEYLRDPAGRDTAARAIPRPRLTGQVREFLRARVSPDGGRPAGCVVPAGTYLVGPGHHLLLRRIERPVRLDEFPVTVARYNRFLDAVRSDGSQQWDHPEMPAGTSHEPWQDRLRFRDYYTNPEYADHPAICVSWWSAYAFARFEGKRLPASLEWEAAARGSDGRLFPWGDEIDLDAVNCADSWGERPLITYETWRAELDRGRLGDARPTAVTSHPANVSPIGVREMAGNTWEWTSTIIPATGDAVICGGSFDNPYRAVQASSKGTYRRRGASNAVGFRCAEDL